VSARRFLAATLVALVTVTTASCSNNDSDEAQATAKKFLDAWSAGNYSGAGALTDAPDGPREWLPAAQKQLGAQRVAIKLGKGSAKGGKGSQSYTVSWQIPGQEKPWAYDGKLTLGKDGDDWKVHWDPSVIHPELAAGQQFATKRTLPERAAVLDRAGQPIFSKVRVVTVGIEPDKAPDLNKLAADLARELAAHKVTAAEIVADAKKAKPTDFVSVVTLRDAQYQQVKPKIYNLPGTVFRAGERLLGPTTTFGQPLLGKVGDATAEVLKEAGPAYLAGDQLGTSGLQRTFNKQLAGVPTVTISLADGSGKAVKQFAELAGKPGDPVKTTLDRGVQTAAEEALAGVPQQAAIVAVKPSTGELLAVANSTSAGFDIALEGKYPPGSTFKIITATALLQSGAVKANATVACPGELVVGGKRFINFDKFNLGNVPLRRAFAKSCNTTFTSLSGKLPAGGLTKTAAQFGVGVDWKLPVASYDGSVPAPRDATELAADSIGQGTVLTSPLSMALAAATVQHGTVPTPVLVAGESTPPATAPAPLDAAVLGPLRDFTRAVVTEGTAAAVLKNAPGGVAGKTGTAEYGDAVPPRSHSWFAGYRGDLAFAVFVWDGASSGKAATPIAGTFLGKVK
jgi:cell division protein FtsI/penicillin-binding protein 2